LTGASVWVGDALPGSTASAGIALAAARARSRRSAMGRGVDQAGPRSTRTMTTTLVTIVVAVVALGALVAFLKQKLEPGAKRDGDAPWPYTAHPVLGAAEQILFHRVVEALPDHMVLAQVQVSRVLRVHEGRADEITWRNKVSQLSFDLLVCTKDAKPLLAIEVDDATHDTASARKRDAKKDRACRDAGLKIVRWRVTKLPDDAGIRAALGTGGAKSGTESPKPLAAGIA